MVTIKTEILLHDVSAEQITDFMINCSDAMYQQWWPGTHIAFHKLTDYPSQVGNIVYFDEYIGKTRLQFKGVVKQYLEGGEICWQMKKGVKLPAWLSLNLEDHNNGIKLTHKLSLGYKGIGRLFDPLIMLFMPSNFEYELNEHAQIEFIKLSQILKIGNA